MFSFKVYITIYLKVSYKQKEDAKKSGLRWSPDVKKWYYRAMITYNVYQFIDKFKYTDNFFLKRCFSFDLDVIDCSGGSIDQYDIKPHVDTMTAYYLHEQKTYRDVSHKQIETTEAEHDDYDF